MNKPIRLRRKIEHTEEIEMDNSNESPTACVDCERKYPLVAGSSNCRCTRCNGFYKFGLEGHSSKLGQIQSERHSMH